MTAVTQAATARAGGARKGAGSAKGLVKGLESDPEMETQRKRLDRQAALEAAMADINDSFGKGTVMRLGAQPSQLETFPSGCLALDMQLGGGLPRGRIMEIFGPESCGKTTLALHAISEIQKAGGNAMLIDAEHAFDPAYAQALGIDVENLIICQPETGEQALETADKLCRSGAMDLIVVDSVSALVPRAEIEGEIGQARIGLQAAMMSQALRKLSGNTSRMNCTMIFINQMRKNVQIYGNPETTSGGMALKYYSSLRLDLRLASGGKIKNKADEDIGVRVKAKVVKSKVSPPYRVAEFDIMFGSGVAHLGCLVDCAVDVGLIAKSGAWYSYNGQRLGQGREKVMATLKESAELKVEIESAIRECISRTQLRMAAAAPAAAGLAPGGAAPDLGEFGDLDDGGDVPAEELDESELMERLSYAEGAEEDALL